MYYVLINEISQLEIFYLSKEIALKFELYNIFSIVLDTVFKEKNPSLN